MVSRPAPAGLVLPDRLQPDQPQRTTAVGGDPQPVQGGNGSRGEPNSTHGTAGGDLTVRLAARPTHLARLTHQRTSEHGTSVHGCSTAPSTFNHSGWHTLPRRIRRSCARSDPRDTAAQSARTVRTQGAVPPRTQRTAPHGHGLQKCTVGHGARGCARSKARAALTRTPGQTTRHTHGPHGHGTRAAAATPATRLHMGPPPHHPTGHTSGAGPVRAPTPPRAPAGERLATSRLSPTPSTSSSRRTAPAPSTPSGASSSPRGPR